MPDDRNIAVATLLKSLMERDGETVTSLAQEFGTSKACISRWMSGKGIKTENLFRLAHYFGITIDEMIEGKLRFEDEKILIARKYNVGDLGTLIKNKDEGELISSYERLLLMKNEYESLFERVVLKKKLSDVDLFKIEIIEKYMDLNPLAFLDQWGNIVLRYQTLKPLVRDENTIKSIREIFDQKTSNDDQLRDWEKSKIVRIERDLMLDELVEGGLIEAFKMAIKCLSVEKRSRLLTSLYRKEGFLEFKRALLDSGAVILKDSIHYETLEPELCDLLEGISIDEPYTEFVTESLKDFRISTDLTFKSFTNLVDEARTKLEKDVVNASSADKVLEILGKIESDYYGETIRRGMKLDNISEA